MIFFNKKCLPGFMLAALIFIPLFAPNLLNDKAFSMKSIVLLCAGLIILALTFAADRIAQAIEGLKTKKE